MMYENNKKHFPKKIATLFFTMVLVTTLVNPIYAKDINSNNEISSEASTRIISCLSNISNEKELYGLKDVNFEKISVGNQIPAYEYIDGKLNILNVSIYPLTVNEKLIAFVINNSGNYQFTTGLVKEISSSIKSNESFALVYDKNTCYAYTENGLFPLNQFGDEYSNGRQKIDKVENISNIKETKLSKFSSVQPLGYSENSDETVAATYAVTTTSNNYVTCEVPYVPQGNYVICWAASIASIGNYLRGINHDAVYVAQCYYGTNFNQGLDDGDTAMIILNSIYNNVSYSYSNGIPTENFIWNKIFTGKPLYGGFQTGNSLAKHAAVICAISTTNDYFCVEDSTCGRLMSSYSGSTYSFYSIGNGMTWYLIGYGASIN